MISLVRKWVNDTERSHCDIQRVRDYFLSHPEAAEEAGIDQSQLFHGIRRVANAMRDGSILYGLGLVNAKALASNNGCLHALSELNSMLKRHCNWAAKAGVNEIPLRENENEEQPLSCVLKETLDKLKEKLEDF